MNRVDHHVTKCERVLVMKFSSFILLPVAMAIVACDTMTSPVSSSSFDPLRPPGTSMQPASASASSELSPGQFVSANIPNTAFYKNEPKGSEDADKLIALGTEMKIIEMDSDYVKVELDSGEVGYVPAVMVSAPDMTATPPDLLALDGAYQVYPPLPGGGPIEPLPIFDPGGIPPDGAIPAIIDPDAPIVTDIPALDTIPEMKVDEPAMEKEEELDPVAEAVRKKVEAAKAEEEKLKQTEAPAETE
jgi:hypothetical protein